MIAETQEAIRNIVPSRARLASGNDQIRQPPQILNEGHSQMDGDCPEFADAERLDPLVGPHERLECLEVESTVGVRHIRPGQPKDARVPAEVVALGYLR